MGRYHSSHVLNVEQPVSGCGKLDVTSMDRMEAYVLGSWIVVCSSCSGFEPPSGEKEVKSN